MDRIKSKWESSDEEIEASPKKRPKKQIKHSVVESPIKPATARHKPRLYAELTPCGSVERYEKLNRIEEGSYGVVYRARDKETNEIVALKRLKIGNERDGFPITSLREIRTLLSIKHPNIVNLRHVVTGGTPPRFAVFLILVFIL